MPLEGALGSFQWKMNSVLITQCVCFCAFSRLLWQFPSAASPSFLPHAVFTTSMPLPLCFISTPTHPILFRCWYSETPAQWNKQPHDKHPHALSEAGLLAAGMLGNQQATARETRVCKLNDLKPLTMYESCQTPDMNNDWLNILHGENDWLLVLFYFSFSQDWFSKLWILRIVARSSLPSILFSLRRKI